MESSQKQQGSGLLIGLVVLSTILGLTATGASISAAVFASDCKDNGAGAAVTTTGDMNSLRLAVTEEEVRSAQTEWANAILDISATFLNGGDYVTVAETAAADLYSYGHMNVLFKPTKAAEQQFRPMSSGALSYFVGHTAIAPDGYVEDDGFAINAGNGWSAVSFDNHQISIIDSSVAVAMGNYYFTSAADSSVSKVEYTFGYKKSDDGHLRIFLHHSSVPYSTPPSITETEVRNAQRDWGQAIKTISQTYLDGGDYVAAANAAAANLYAYGHVDNVLFKPTKAVENQFRPTATGALSYFVGYDAIAPDGYTEDAGFAHNGGKGWSEVVFDNHRIDIEGNVATAMGNYFFTSAEDGSVSKVEYTFGYKKDADGHLRIYLHHSSAPWDQTAAGAETISHEEVLAVQEEWGNAIKNISQTYLDGGNYVAAANAAAAKLYGYGHVDNVLFKPTKAAENQFRPTATGALSYFVGHDAIAPDGYTEDDGFAHNSGMGWSEVVFDNHQIDISGGGKVAMAMGNYYFTSVVDGSVSKVEYTFGYQKIDGNLRIYVHHSSVPYRP